MISLDEKVLKKNEKCRFRAVGCTDKATTRNKWDVAMCENCFKIWDKLRERNDGKVRYCEMISFAPKPKIEQKQSSETDDPADEFYCGEY